MRKAKLYIKGQKEPVVLDEREGRAAQDLLLSPKPGETIFAIEGVWAGRKSDLRYVMFEKAEESNVQAEEVKPMSWIEAKEFEREIKQDKREAGKRLGMTKKIYKNGQLHMVIPSSVKWAEFYYERKGAIRLEIVEGNITWFMRDPRLLESLERTIESYWAFTRKRDFAIAKENEHYEGLAEGMEELVDHMTVTHDTDHGGTEA